LGGDRREGKRGKGKDRKREGEETAWEEKGGGSHCTANKRRLILRGKTQI